MKDFAYTLSWQSHTSGYTIVPGTTASDIMGCFTPEALPVLSALARGYAVCDHWYASAPTETLPNRAFACAATSQGHMDDKTHTFTCPSIFGLLGNHQLGWSIYGYDSEPLTKSDFPDISSAAASHFGHFTDFTAAAAAGTLPPFTFLEPSWSSSGNSQHPNYNVALGEQLIHDVYEALRGGPGWAQTLLVITYDEHGGCYDHVPPPAGATPPDNDAGEFGFDFTRFGVRVPAVLVSPLIPAGTVFRVPDGSVPLDHTSILKTVEQRWNLPAAHRQGRGRPRRRRRAQPHHGAHRRRAVRGDRAHGQRRGAVRRAAVPPAGSPGGADLAAVPGRAERHPGRGALPGQRGGPGRLHPLPRRRPPRLSPRRPPAP